MPIVAITPRIGTFLRAEKAKGTSHRAMAAAVLATFGRTIDHSTIGDFLRKTAAKAVKKPSKAAKSASKRAPKVKALGPRAPIVESERLDAAIRRLEHLLTTTDDPREVAALTQELRQCLRQLRMEKDSADERSRASNTDVARLRHQLLKLYAPTAAPLDHADQPEVPDVNRASGSG